MIAYEVHFTRREWQVLLAMAHGLSLKETSLKLGIACSTVKNFRTQIFEKLDVNSAGQAVRECIRREVFSPETFEDSDGS